MSALSNLKALSRLAIILFLTAGPVSCIYEDDMESPAEGTTATLRLSTRSSVTRSDGLDDLEADPYKEGEDAIGRVNLFFYANGTDRSAAPFYSCELDVKAVTSTDVSVTIPKHLVDDGAAASGKAYVYALANLPAGVTVDASASLDDLQTLWVGNPGFVSAKVPASFVMRGAGEVSLSGGGSSVGGTILLERLASKIRLWADIPEKIYVDLTTGKTIEQTASDFSEKMEDGQIETWESVPTSSNGRSDVRLYLYNLTQRGRIDGYVGDRVDEPGHPERLEYADIDHGNESSVRLLATDATLPAADKDDKYPYTHTVAYYSYPNTWNSSQLGEPHRTHVILSVPWRKVEGNDAEYRVSYYSVPVNALASAQKKAGREDCLEPNCYYRIKLRVGMLGNANPGEAPEIDASYEVVPWTSEPIDVSIRDRRYLVVNQKEWVMNNTWTLQIPFSSSHKTEVKCYVNFFRYNDIWGNEPQSMAVTYNTTGGYQEFGGTPKYNKQEFSVWKNRGGDTEQLLENVSFDGTSGNILYYKPEYFVGNFYVGREHPITFHPDKVGNPGTFASGSKEAEAWEMYNAKYDKLDSVYTCWVDHKKSVINFSHPLVVWDKVPEAGGAAYYVPKINTRTGNLWNEYSRCEIIIKIKHEDWDSDRDHLYEETIHVTQYPAIYVEESHDYGSIATPYRYFDWSSLRNRYRYYGGNEYVRINGEVTYNRTDADNTKNADYEIGLYGAFGVTNSLIQYDATTNMNPNMYVIHVSRLSDEEEKLYEIGDPRSLTNNINLSEGSFKDSPARGEEPDVRWESWPLTASSVYPSARHRELVSAPHWNNGKVDKASATFDHYYPTDETDGAGSKENFIAPVIRIASSFGKIQYLAKFEARRRCATYQEAGRPAGRWRLPTRAEVEYVASLSRDGIIPVLFGPTGNATKAYYWTASGVVSVDRQAEIDVIKSDDDRLKNDMTVVVEGGVSNSISVRCVYDDWYWIKEDGTEDVVTPESSMGTGQPADAYWGKVTTFYWGDKEKDNTQAQALARKRILADE